MDDFGELKQLERSQARLQLIADEMNAAVFEWSNKEDRFYTSSSYHKYALSEISAEDLLNNRGPTDLIHPEDEDILHKFFSETRKNKNRVEVTLRLKMMNGEYHWCRMIGLFYYDENDNLERTVGIIIDVNEEHEKSFMLDSMINSMPCGVGIFVFAKTLICHYHSDGFSKMAGISREEMNKKIADNTVLSSLIAPADFPRIGALLAELTSKGLPLNLTYRYVYSDGSLRWLHLSAKKLREENGYPVYYCVFTNPTEETAQYGDVVVHSPTGVYVAEKATRKSLYANEAATVMFGFPKDHIVKDRHIEDALKETGRKPLLTDEQIKSLSTDAYTEFHINQNGKYYQVKAKEILWNGIVSYIMYFSDESNEQTLISSIPGGVAIYRVKKDGRVTTDFVSDGLAAMCNYTADEFLALLKNDAIGNIVPEDVPRVMEKVQAALGGDGTISVMYRIYTKSHEELMIRLDANKMPETRLEEDDIAAFYAVHTFVSDEVKRIIEDQKQLHKLIDEVPAGIGIYEVSDGVVRQSYMNDAFYAMIGSKRNQRMEYGGENAINAVHPDDVAIIKPAIQKLLDGGNKTSLTYRLHLENGEWFWVHQNGSVVERSENHIKIYAAFSDYNEIIRAQQAMEYNRHTLTIALKSADVLSWRYDYKHNRITDSGTLGEVYNLPRVIDNVPESIIDLGLIDDESKEAFRQVFRDISTKKTAKADVKAIAVDGKSPAWFRLIYTPIYDKDGVYIDAVGVGIDITEQKKKEQLYEEKQRLYKAASGGAMSTVSMNLTQNLVTGFTSNSAEFDENKQYVTANELLSSIREKQKDTKENAKFQAVSSVSKMLKMFESGKTHYEIVFHYHSYARWLKVTYDMLKNPYTGDVEAISSIYDVTDSIRAQKVIQQLIELDYQSLLLVDSKTGNAIPYQNDYEKDVNMDEVMKLQEKCKNGQEAVEKFLRAYAVPGTAEQAIKENSLDYIKEKLKTHPYYECMYSLIQDGKLNHYRIIYCYMKNDTGLIFSAVQNVTEMYEKEMRQKNELSKALVEAESANKAKTAFLSRVSHDMRTPLNGILGLTSLMKDIAVSPKVIQDLNQLELSGKYLLNLINDTLDVSRIESGKLELHPSVCDSRKVIDNIIKLSLPAIEAKNIKLSIDVDTIPLIPIYFDEGRLQQVALNIMSNATKFTGEGGKIELTGKCLSVENGIVTDEFTIRDNGIGMSKEFLPHLLEPFAQENATNTNSKNGTGLGMAITNNIVTLMNGKMTVESEKGKGTSVSIVIPFPIATDEQISEWKKSIRPHAASYNLENKRVLLCEDHPLNTQIAKRILEKVGVKVEHAENGKIGVEMFSSSDVGFYDAILMDIRMPVMDGLDAAKAIRSLDKADAKTVPIIAMTANALDEDIKRTSEVGMNAHLSKPIVPQNLYRTLEMLVNPTEAFTRQRILVVDDMEVNRSAIRTALSSEYEVFEADSAEKALKILDEHNGMDAVITDIQMPGMDGFEFIKIIRSKEQYRHMVIIANTQFDNPGQEERLLSLGTNDFIYKPANPEIVKIRMKNALGKQ